MMYLFVWQKHTHPFNGPFSGTTRVSRYQKGKTNLDFTEARDSEWQWHQLGHTQVCTIQKHTSNKFWFMLCFRTFLLEKLGKLQSFKVDRDFFRHTL